MIDVSIVIPVFNEEGTVQPLTEKILSVLNRESLTGEIYFVDDGSTDKTTQILDELEKTFDNVHVIHFRRNRGKAAALQAGFRKAKGKFVITMDGDLQDDPEEIPNLLQKLHEGWDMVSGWKKIRHDPVSKTLPSKIFNKTTSFLTGIRIHDFNCGLKAYRKEVVQSISLYGELHRYIPVLAKMEGFRVTEIPVTHHPRTSGKSKYGTSRMLKGFFDLITVLFLARFTQRPMHFFGMLGILSVIIGVIVEIWVLVLKYAFHEPFQSHLAMLLFGILLLILGIQLFSMGLIGEMLVYQFRKNRGKYGEENE
ncbi:MAG: glycosyltransferase family 2 protein [Candidatus Marinimicrobia bacterium]|nr:glycosyltransferase family 2 protein [Candidatus Neomarinimicrobiota bacterium]MDD5582207.1 glycosyltransferase family 2 protein [Candidatus Neomarinimicrobiota bacterium]